MVEQRATAFVIVYFVAIFFQFGLGSSTAVLETMQNDFHTLRVQGFDLVENKNDAAVVRRVGNVKRNDVQIHTRREE